MFSCPACGRPMRIVVRAGRRSWSCTGRTASPACTFEQGIADDIRLSADDIAQAALYGRDNGDQLARDQAAHRRTAGALERVDADSPYLSGKERDLLRQAATVLRRLGEAAEVAKRQKKQREKDLAQVAKRRREHVQEALKARYLEAGLTAGDAYLILAALARRA